MVELNNKNIAKGLIGVCGIIIVFSIAFTSDFIYNSTQADVDTMKAKSAQFYHCRNSVIVFDIFMVFVLLFCLSILVMEKLNQPRCALLAMITLILCLLLRFIVGIIFINDSLNGTYANTKLTLEDRGVSSDFYISWKRSFNMEGSALFFLTFVSGMLTMMLYQIANEKISERREFAVKVS